MDKNTKIMDYPFFLEKFILPFGDFVNRSFFLKHLYYWRNIDHYTENQLKSLQIDNLRKLLVFAVKNIPKYRDINLKGENPYEWIQQFPLLTKEELKTNTHNLTTKNLSRLIKYNSSGSTGIQTSVYMTKYEQSNIRAMLIHWWEWSGYKIGNPIVQTGITPNRGLLKMIKDILFRTIYINSFNHSVKQLEKLCDKLQKNPNIFHLSGYSSSLNILAEYVQKNNYNVQLKSVISFGDKLFSHYKRNIKLNFNCKVYDTYGSNEGFLIAAQKDIEYKYIMSPHVYLEILDDENNPVADGELGNVVVSRLDCFSMPLIRYKIGDLAAKLPKDKYPPKREFKYPLLEKTVGRETDVVLLPGGEKLVVHSFTGVFENIPEIKQFQIVQEKIESIKIKYVKSNNFKDDTLEKTTLELQKQLQNYNMKIYYEEVNFIPPSKSGKPQIIESKIKKINKCKLQ